MEKININEKCPKCRTEMKKGTKLNSGNTTFQEYVCPNCNAKISRAIGVNK